MTRVWSRPAADVAVLTIEHHPAQSWSRAVDPAAMRAARAPGSPLSGQWTLVSSDYCQPAPEGRTASVYRFERGVR